MISRALESGYFMVPSVIFKPADDHPPPPDKVYQSSEIEEEPEDPEMCQRGLPAVAVRLSDEFSDKYPYVKQGWIQVPEGEADTELLRIVVRETLSEDLVERLIVDILEITESLMQSEGLNDMMAVTSGTHHPDHEWAAG